MAKQRLFSVAHNALTNAYKYAQASRVNVVLAFDGRDISLSIVDDGVGMDPREMEASSGHGLRNMCTVARELGGTFDVSSAPGKGTTVAIVLPIEGVKHESP